MLTEWPPKVETVKEFTFEIEYLNGNIQQETVVQSANLPDLKSIYQAVIGRLALYDTNAQLKKYGLSQVSSISLIR